MRGNAYLIIPKGQFSDLIPNRVKNSYGWNEPLLDAEGKPVLDEKGEPGTTDIHPTWQQVAEKFKSDFGEVREIEYSGNRYMVVELELSFLSGEIEDLISLKKNKVFPRYRLLTNKEAKRFVKGALSADDETFR